MNGGNGGGQLVVVPLEPGPVRPLPVGARERDELDEIADELLEADDERPPGLVRGGAHAALVEVATSLDGRPAADATGRRFVAERAGAVAALADALEAQPVVRRDQLIEARGEAIDVGGFDTLTVLGGLVEEVRSGGHHA